MIFFCTKVGDKFGPEYVNRLYAMIKRNYTRPFRFVCTTDRTEGLNPEVERYQPRRQCWGWWNLVEAYSPGFTANDPSKPSTHATICYMGLDTVITGNIDVLHKHRDKYVLMNDFSTEMNYDNIYRGTYADGVAMIPEPMPWLWDAFVHEIGPDSTHPMHVWVTEKLKEKDITPKMWQDLEPDLLCSIKWPTFKRKQPKQPIVLFHGRPSIQEAMSEASWIEEHWRE